MDAEALYDEFFEILTGIANNELPSQQLSIFMQEIKERCDNDPLQYQDFLEEMFPEVICEAVNEVINDSEWRSDEIGPNAITDAKLLQVLFPVLCDLDQNIEIVFATNPHTPADIMEILCNSTYEWEEDGTTSALARSTSDVEILRKLSKSADPSTRFSVAANIHTPLDILETLASDEGFSRHMEYMSFDGGWHGQVSIELDYIRCSIKYAVIENPTTSVEVLERIAKTERNFDFAPDFEVFGSKGEEINRVIREEAFRILKGRI